jgi:hypothetical protein
MYPPARPRANAVTIERTRPRSNAVTRVVLPGDLKAGDILFKHASSSLISKAIKAGQGSHYRATKATLLEGAKKTDQEAREAGSGSNYEEMVSANMPSQAEAKDITHVALAAGCNDVLEFDEGGGGTKILTSRGYGFVRGPMSVSGRQGKTYEVFRCTHEGLWKKAVDKADLVWDLTHADPTKEKEDQPRTGSYAMKKVFGTAVMKEKGPEVNLNYFESTLNKWLVGDKTKTSDDTNGQFFCSHFVLFCYLWAAAEVQQGGTVRGLDFVLGDKVRVSPAELYTRIKGSGWAFFTYQGTLTNPKVPPPGKPEVAK